MILEMRNKLQAASKQQKLYLLVSIWNILLFVFLIFWGSLFQKSPENIVFFTGTLGGKNYQLGKVLRSIIEEQSNFSVTLVSTDGDVENISRLSEYGDGGSFAFFIKRNVNLLKEQIIPTDHETKTLRGETIRCVTLLSKVVVQIVIRDSVISRMEDLKDRRVYVGKSKSGTRLYSEKILESLNLTFNDLQNHGQYDTLGYLEAGELVRDGLLDAAIFNAMMPTDGAKAALQSEETSLLYLDSLFVEQLISITDSTNEYYKTENITDFYPEIGYREIPYVSVSSDVIMATNTKTRPFIVWKIMNLINESQSQEELRKIIPELNSYANYEAFLDNLQGCILPHNGTKRFYSSFWNLWYRFQNVISLSVGGIIIIIFSVQTYLVFQIHKD